MDLQESAGTIQSRIKLCKLTGRRCGFASHHQSLHNSLAALLDISARRAEMGAPSCLEVRDALTPYRILTRLFAFFQAWDRH